MLIMENNKTTQDNGDHCTQYFTSKTPSASSREHTPKKFTDVFWRTIAPTLCIPTVILIAGLYFSVQGNRCHYSIGSTAPLCGAGVDIGFCILSLFFVVFIFINAARKKKMKKHRTLVSQGVATQIEPINKKEKNIFLAVIKWTTIILFILIIGYIVLIIVIGASMCSSHYKGMCR